MSGTTQPPTTAYGFYLRLWHAGFRWLYVVDALGVFSILVAVMAVRFGTEWPEPAASWVGIMVATALVQVVFYFGGLYEKQVRLGQRMWFSRVAGLTLVGLAVSAVLVLPTGRYPVPRANLPAVGVLVAFFATGSRELSRRLRARRPHDAPKHPRPTSSPRRWWGAPWTGSSVERGPGRQGCARII